MPARVQIGMPVQVVCAQVPEKSLRPGYYSCYGTAPVQPPPRKLSSSAQRAYKLSISARFVS